MASPDELVEIILNRNSGADVATVANELLRALHRGYPVANLQRVLGSQDSSTAEVGMFIASELGNKAKPLLPVIATLLKHPSKTVRFDALDCILTCADAADGAIIASAISLINDDEAGVRWKAMNFLFRASGEQLRAALIHIEKTAPGSNHRAGIEFLLREGGLGAEDVSAILESGDATSRRYGVVAAARMSRQTPGPLMYASSSDDIDVRCFAEDRLKLNNG